MKKYIGTKIVTAAPMSRHTYGEYCGQPLFESMHSDAEGYLVRQPEHSRCDTWMPKDQFENAYQEVVADKKTETIHLTVFSMADSQPVENELVLIFKGTNSWILAHYIPSNFGGFCWCFCDGEQRGANATDEWARLPGPPCISTAKQS